MEEARRVMERLERIEALQRAEAPATALLAEVRMLLRDGERWLAAEGGGAAAALGALERCRGSVQRAGEVMPTGAEGPDRFAA
jgi:hypothetical protein